MPVSPDFLVARGRPCETRRKIMSISLANIAARGKAKITGATEGRDPANHWAEWVAMMAVWAENPLGAAAAAIEAPRKTC
jgi:hypothetical protein